MRNLFATFFTFLIVIGSISNAQEKNLQILLQQNPQLFNQNPGLLKQFTEKSAGETSTNPIAGVPSSKSPSVANADDLFSDPNIIFQTKENKSDVPSILKRYFSILTGKLLPVYGAAEFNQKQDNELLFFNTMSTDYRLGAGDVIRVTLRGIDEKDLNLKVAKNGMLFIRGLPPINVNGRTLLQAEEQLRSLVTLDDASASVFLSLETARLISVQVSGNVNSPKTIAVPAYTPLSRVLSYIGGVSDTGSLRKIALQHQGGRVEYVDFYNFLRGTLLGSDPVITDNARIFVTNKGPTIAASGYVSRPGIYELPADKTQISILKLLEMTGTTLIPPGAILEILSFDEAGMSKAFSTGLNQNIKQGEALRIRFVETRNLANISVKGAVLESFDFASTTAIPVKDILKNGSVLTQDALLSFAMIDQKDGQSTAINLNDALRNRSIQVSPGSTLHIFTQDEFNKLVIADPNETTDPLVSKISETDVSEIYLNGRRIAFVPPSTGKSFNEVIRPFYGFTPQTVLDFALVQINKEGNTISSAVSVRNLLQQDGPFNFKAGTKVFLFERAFYSTLLTRTDNLKSSVGVEFNVVSEALIDSQVVSISLDGEPFALLPSENPQTLKNILQILRGLPVSISNDLAILSFAAADQIPEAVTLNEAKRRMIVGDTKIDFFTDNGLRKIIDEIERGRNDTLALNLKARANKVFIDGQMIAAFGQFDDLSTTSFSDILRSDSTIYPIFSTVSEYRSVSGTWERKTFTLKQLLNEQLDTAAGARFDLLTKPFVASVLEGTTESNLLSAFADDRVVIEGPENALKVGEGVENSEVDLSTAPVKIEDLTKNESSVFDRRLLNERFDSVRPKVQKTEKRLPPSLTLVSLQNSSRYVGGGVERPGSYPAADQVTLAELVQIAGGFTPGADIKNIIVQDYKIQGGKLNAAEPRLINGKKNNLDEIVLFGQFSVNVQTFINDAFSGSISLQGEVNRPGEYIFARSETLHDVLVRASGVSDAAYPLGAVFERRSAKQEEKASNVILAEKIEQSVLQLSSTDVQGGGEQISAILGFANQLKKQEPVGRLSVNILLRDKSVPIYLEDGDRLVIPKRPSHVSVIGSVSQSVRANYGPRKDFQDYIANAGGYSAIADKSRVYMLLPNGEASPLNNKTIIPPGAVLIVPPKTDKLSILGLTDLVSRVLGNIATSILAINNVQ